MTLNEQLKADKAALERTAVDQYYEHARQLHDLEREQETLERVVQFLETEQVSIMVRRTRLDIYLHSFLTYLS